MKVAILLLVSIIAVLSIQDDNAQEFKDFMAKYNKVYSSEEEMNKRFEIFIKSKDTTEKMNSKSKSARYGVTKFSDLSPEEFQAQYLNYKPSADKASMVKPQIALSKNIEIPSSFDWRNKSAVTPTKNQGQCGSCWAFSTTEAVESAWFLAGNTLPVLSPQQIVDCDQGNGDLGCQGGDTTTAYAYLMKAGGLESESDYPYVGETSQSCAFNSKDIVASISNWTYITTTKDENEMQAGLVQYGPLSICVDAASWQYYIEGVVGDLCGDSLDHCVQVTGYGDYSDVFGDYQVWNVRNSWGEDWGYGGYLYVERGYDYCGIADEVTWPLIK